MIISSLCSIENAWHWHSRHIWKWNFWISSNSISHVFIFNFVNFSVNRNLFICELNTLTIIRTNSLKLIKCLKLSSRSLSIVKRLINFLWFESLTIILKDCWLLNWLFRTRSISSSTSRSISIHFNDSFIVKSIKLAFRFKIWRFKF